MDPEPRRLGLFRTAGTLQARLCAPAPGGWACVWAAPAAADRALTAAWARLGNVGEGDADTVDDVLLVLRETLAAERTVRQRLFEDVPPAPPPRASAAHPRAFRGTTVKPPKTERRPLGDWPPSHAARTTPFGRIR